MRLKPKKENLEGEWWLLKVFEVEYCTQTQKCLIATGLANKGNKSYFMWRPHSSKLTFQ